jgi:hypothetical protein
MSEIRPERPSLQTQPLPVSSLPAGVAALAGAAAPAKLMVTKGMSTLRPGELLLALYQLSFDGEASVRTAALAAPAAFPDNVIVPPLREPLPAAVLHFFAERLPAGRVAAIEQILYNPATADETFVLLAQRLEERGLDIIFSNEVRLLRCPAIVETLFFNRHARMSSVNRALELCARNGVRVDNIPGFEEIVAAIREDPEALDPTSTDARFEAAMATAEALAPASAGSGGARLDAGDEEFDEDDDVAPEGKQQAIGMSFIKFDKLKIFEKIRLATVGNAYCRQVLIRDSNKLIALAVVRSPQMTDMEIVRAASSTTVCDDVIRFIAGNRQLMKDYAVKLALVKNPKCPLGSSLRFLNYLNQEDLKDLSRSKNVPGALAVAAKKLLATREARK